MNRKGLPFWGALTILLTMLSPNLEAETIDPREGLTEQPYELKLTLQNVDFNRFE